MRSSSKMVVTGALGGLAAVVVAGSGAFACTADATVGVVQGYDSLMPEKPTVRAGERITLGVKSFQSGRDVVVNWINPYTGQISELARLTGPSYNASFDIPMESFNSRHDRPYILQALQTGTYTRSRQVFLTGGKEWTEPLLPPVATSEQAPVVAPATPAADIGVAPDAAGTQVAAAAPVSGGTTEAAASIAAAVSSSPPPAQAGSAAPIASAQAAPAPIPVGPPAPPENTAPPSGELWSGLTADGSGNLLESATTTPPSNGAPAGGVALLGMGILSLAGVAVEATRRRLVLAKVTRRR